jgi:hypothetical protein
MSPSVRTKLDTIFGYPFFQSVGRPLPATVKAVDTWGAAVKQATSIKWENCRLQGSNVLSELLGLRERDMADTDEQFRHWQRREQWNPLADELRPLIRSFVDALHARTGIEAGVAEKIKSDLSWDIMAISLEEEYKDLEQPPFYLTYLDPWYASGHFPCGWDGKQFPERWPEKEVPYLNANRVSELWGSLLRKGRLIVF